MLAHLPAECLDDCPAIKVHEQIIIAIKGDSNVQIAESLGLASMRAPECPAKGIKRCR
ncbi:MAG TPA: hypothetical protein VGK23_07350 [Methanomassiliicoccales archaeon]